MGVMSYLASPLWLLFLIATGVEGAHPDPSGDDLLFGENWIPVWPVSFAVEMTTVLLVTLTMLFLPVIGPAAALERQPAASRLWWDVRGDPERGAGTVFSVLTAPVLMLFQTKFVLAILLRRAVGWPTQQRGDHMTSFKEAALAHGGHTLTGVVVGVLSYQYVPAFFWWFTPVLLGLLLSIPVSMLSSSIALGRKSRELGLFLTPEETDPPSVLRYLDENLREDDPVLPVLWDRPSSRFVQALTDPYVNALHLSLLPESEPPGKRRRHYLEGLIHQLEEEGPDSLSAAQKRELIADSIPCCGCTRCSGAGRRPAPGCCRSGVVLASWEARGYNPRPGEVAEWSIAAVLKTVDPRGSEGSNPPLRQIAIQPR